MPKKTSRKAKPITPQARRKMYLVMLLAALALLGIVLLAKGVNRDESITPNAPASQPAARGKDNDGGGIGSKVYPTPGTGSKTTTTKEKSTIRKAWCKLQIIDPLGLCK